MKTVSYPTCLEPMIRLEFELNFATLDSWSTFCRTVALISIVFSRASMYWNPLVALLRRVFPSSAEFFLITNREIWS